MACASPLASTADPLCIGVSLERVCVGFVMIRAIFGYTILSLGRYGSILKKMAISCAFCAHM